MPSTAKTIPQPREKPPKAKARESTSPITSRTIVPAQSAGPRKWKSILLKIVKTVSERKVAVVMRKARRI